MASSKPTIRIYEDKENIQNIIKISLNSKSRNPLSELGKNVTEKTKSQSSYTKITKSKDTITSYTSTEINYLKKVSVRTVAEKDEFSCKEDSGNEKKNPTQKVNLARKLSSRRQRCNEQDIYRNCFYDEEYLEDNYHLSLKTENFFIFNGEILKKNVDENYRISIVNWMNALSQYFSLQSATFFVAVRMLDSVFYACKVPLSNYKLTALICLWTANKQFDVQNIRVLKLVSICKGKYTKAQFLEAEKEILGLLQFRVNFPEPASFLFYYMRQAKIENNEKIRNGASFLLELFTLLLEFSSLAPSLLASMALFMTLTKYDFDSLLFLDYIQSHLLDRDTFLCLTNRMRNCVQEILNSKVTSDIVKKYSNEDYVSVAQDFIK